MADLEREHISVTEASGRGVARLVADAAHGAEVVVTRRGAPVAAVVSFERLAALDELRARPARPGAGGRARRPTTTAGGSRSTTCSTPSGAFERGVP